ANGAQLSLDLEKLSHVRARQTHFSGVVIDREEGLVSSPKRLSRVRQTQPLQEAVEVRFDVLDFRQIPAPEDELKKRVVEQVLGFGVVAAREADRPVSEPDVSRNKELLVSLDEKLLAARGRYPIFEWSCSKRRGRVGR